MWTPYIRRISVSETETEMWREGAPLPFFLQKALSQRRSASLPFRS
jgi:hypothetical protein